MACYPYFILKKRLNNLTKVGIEMGMMLPIIKTTSHTVRYMGILEKTKEIIIIKQNTHKQV